MREGGGKRKWWRRVVREGGGRREWWRRVVREGREHHSERESGRMAVVGGDDAEGSPGVWVLVVTSGRVLKALFLYPATIFIIFFYYYFLFFIIFNFLIFVFSIIFLFIFYFIIIIYFHIFLFFITLNLQPFPQIGIFCLI